MNSRLGFRPFIQREAPDSDTPILSPNSEALSRKYRYRFAKPCTVGSLNTELVDQIGNRLRWISERVIEGERGG